MDHIFRFKWYAQFLFLYNYAILGTFLWLSCKRRQFITTHIIVIKHISQVKRILKLIQVPYLLELPFLKYNIIHSAPFHFLTSEEH